MPYTKQTWTNDASTPLSASRMSYIETGIDEAHDTADAALPKAGGTMTGKITLDGVPTADLHAATKSYVDNNALLLTGGTMTGKITLDGAPSASLHAATKAYVDTQVSGVSQDAVHIADVSGTGASATLTFTLSSTYDVFHITGSATHDSTGVKGADVRFNGDTTSGNYKFHRTSWADDSSSISINYSDTGDGIYTEQAASLGSYDIWITNRTGSHVGVRISYTTVGSSTGNNRTGWITATYLSGPVTSMTLVLVGGENWTTSTTLRQYGYV